MRITAIAVAGFGLVAAGTAVAGERISDTQFLKANRCRALAASDALGPMDTAGIDAFLKDAGRNRNIAVMNMAQDEQIRARREARSAERKTKLQAELNGACVAYLQPRGDSGRP